MDSSKVLDLFLCSKEAAKAPIKAEDIAEFAITQIEGMDFGWNVFIRFLNEEKTTGDLPGYGAAVVVAHHLLVVDLVENTRQFFMRHAPYSMRCEIDRTSKRYRRLAGIRELAGSFLGGVPLRRRTV